MFLLIRVSHPKLCVRLPYIIVAICAIPSHTSTGGAHHFYSQRAKKNKRKNMKMWFWDIVRRCTGFIFSCITALTKRCTFRVCILMLLVHVILRRSTYEKWKKDRLMVSCFFAELPVWGSEVESQAKMWEWGQTILCDVSWCKYLVCYNSYNFTSFQLVNKKSLWNV